MENVNIRFKKILLKAFSMAENWQQLHKENCERFIEMIRDLSSWTLMSGILGETQQASEMDSSKFGIFQYFPKTTTLIQGTYVKKLEESYCTVYESLTKFENICHQLDVIQQEADSFYHLSHSELLTSMERKRSDNSQYNFAIVEEYVSGVREIFIMFKKELLRYQDLFKNKLNYIGQSHEEIQELYRQYSSHKFININRVVQILETTERETHLDKVDKHSDIISNQKKMYKNDFIGEATKMLFGKRSSLSSTHSEQSQHSQQQQHDIKQAVNVVEQIANVMYTIDQAVQRIQLSISIIPTIDALKGDIAEGLSESEKKIGELERYCEERIKQPTGSATDADEIGLGRILEKTTNLKKQLSSLQVKFRKAVQIYSNKENESKLKREKLIGFENVQISRKSSQNIKQQSRQSRKITDTLNRTKAIVSSNLERTSYSMEKLSEQASIFDRAINIQEGYQDKVKQSTMLIKDLKWKERRDHFITIGCFLFYLVVVLIVFNHRIPIFTLTYYFGNLIFGGSTATTTEPTIN